MKPRMIVAEDSAINAKMISFLLKKMEIEHVVVPDGSKVMEILSKEYYDFVLMDIYMPVMDGLEATRAIRQGFPKSLQPIIIALTGNTEGEDKANCLAAGMNDFVTKPLTADGVQTIIDKWFRTGN